MKNRLKHILAAALVSFISIASFTGVKAAVNNYVPDIVCEDGYIAVKGSFEASEKVNEKYRVIVGIYDKNENCIDSRVSGEYTVCSGINLFDFKTDKKSSNE